MKNRIKWSLVTCMLVAVGLVSGCGGGHDNDTPAPPVQAKSATIPVTANPVDNTAVTTGLTVVTPSGTIPQAVAAVKVTLTAATTITAKNAAGVNIPVTTFTFQAPANASASSAGTSSVPVATGFSSLESASVAIDVQITGAASSTFSKPISIVLPTPGNSPGDTIATLYQVKSDGLSKKVEPGNFTVSPERTITVQVNDLCWFIGDPVYKTATGSTGGSGSSGYNW